MAQRAISLVQKTIFTTEMTSFIAHIIGRSTEGARGVVTSNDGANEGGSASSHKEF